MTESPAPVAVSPPPIGYELEAIRFRSEVKFADELATQAFAIRQGEQWTPPTAERVRRRLLTNHVRLSQNIAPELFAYCHDAVTALGITKEVELYQAAGDENAANWICAEALFVSLQGAMLQQLDRATLIALLGHEFGHHLAHTDSFAQTPRQHAIARATQIAFDPVELPSVRALASRLAMAKEFTADRFAVLATGSLDGAARLLMSIVNRATCRTAP